LLVYDKEEPVTDNLITWVFDENSFVPAAKLQGNRSNLIYLPTEEGIHPTRSIHKSWNKGHKEYNDYIKGQLEDIWDKGKDGKWTLQQFRDAIEELRRETRLELRNGSRKCYSIH